jgi:hypothetical protein
MEESGCDLFQYKYKVMALLLKDGQTPRGTLNSIVRVAGRPSLGGELKYLLSLLLFIVIFFSPFRKQYFCQLDDQGLIPAKGGLHVPYNVKIEYGANPVF